MTLSKNMSTGKPVEKKVATSHNNRLNQGKHLSESTTEILEAINKPKMTVNAKRTIDLLSEQETKGNNQMVQKGKMKFYNALRVVMSLYALAMVATFYVGMENAKGVKAVTPAIAALTLSMGLMEYGRRQEKNRLVTAEIKHMRRQKWGLKPTPAQAWMNLRGESR